MCEASDRSEYCHGSCVHYPDGLPTIHHRSSANRCPKIGCLRTQPLAFDTTRVASYHQGTATHVRFKFHSQSIERTGITRANFQAVIRRFGFLGTKLIHAVSRLMRRCYCMETHQWVYY